MSKKIEQPKVQKISRKAIMIPEINHHPTLGEIVKSIENAIDVLGFSEYATVNFNGDVTEDM